MEIVLLFAEKWQTTPFDVLERDIDDFIMTANYLVKIGKKSPKSKTVESTADDGFWDM